MTTTVSGGGGGGYPGVTSDGSIPPGLALLGALLAGGNGVFTGDLSSGGATFETLPGGGILVQKTDDNFAGLTINLTNGSDGAEFRISQADGGGVQRTVCVINADGSIESKQGISMHGVAAQVAARTLAQSVITAITDANIKSAIQACANALSDTGPLVLT